MEERQTEALLEGLGSALDAFGGAHSPIPEPHSIASAFALDGEAIRGQWDTVMRGLSSSLDSELQKAQEQARASLKALSEHVAESFAQVFMAAVGEILANRIGEEVAKAAASAVVRKLRETKPLDEVRVLRIGDAVRARVAKNVSEAVRTAFEKRAAAAR